MALAYVNSLAHALFLSLSFSIPLPTSLIIVKKEKPQFLSKPKDVSVNQGEDVHFEAETSGKPAPKIEWTYGKIPMVTSDRVSMESDGNKHSLVIKAAKLLEAGQYTIKATNDQGSLSANAKLKVISKLFFILTCLSYANLIRYDRKWSTFIGLKQHRAMALPLWL